MRRPLPRSWTGIGRNHFSVLFIAILSALAVPPPRLWVYARINHCFRSWVTACDNLLDGELKEMILTDLPAGALVFKSVHTLLLTDRIFLLFLHDALDRGVLTKGEVRRLCAVTLASLGAR